MSSTDDLRTAITGALLLHNDDVVSTILVVLADPARRLAILDAMGLDVVEEGTGLDRLPRLVVRPRGEATDV